MEALILILVVCGILYIIVQTLKEPISYKVQDKYLDYALSTRSDDDSIESIASRAALLWFEDSLSIEADNDVEKEYYINSRTEYYINQLQIMQCDLQSHWHKKL